MVSRLALICTLAVVLYYPRALAQLRTAKNCCLPKQWEGFQGGIGGVETDKGGQAVQTIAKITFDAVGRRVYAYSNSTTAAGMSSTKLIQDYKTNTMYVIDVLKRTCQKTKTNLPFNNGCVPDDAKQVFDMTIGAGVRHCRRRSTQCDCSRRRPCWTSTLVSQRNSVSLSGRTGSDRLTTSSWSCRWGTSTSPLGSKTPLSSPLQPSVNRT
ncbi:uncharacterized protein LOC124261677 [Haliotis rubra]|uniref:uncharacterized protein LOC124261677 n=1 Tax=Haliotis rubra TaxID=36100 RepID=UPI001EE61CD4|nr:uncharacterized protein LOC124261677 [Haliotis rubra]